MTDLSELKIALLDILHAAQPADLKIIIGGGYGIYLKHAQVRNSGERTLLQIIPEARATNDLDLFLRPELLIESNNLDPLASALRRLGYSEVKGAEKYQFIKNPSGPRTIKIDLLTGPKSSFQGTSVKVSDRRVQPKPSVGVHAHPVDEALTLEEGLMEIALEGILSTGEIFNGTVYIPHCFTYLMMKLYAFRDRLEDETKDYGSYHALDLYTILATTTESEWNKAKELSILNRDRPEFREASRLVAEYFSSEQLLGIIRIKESKYYEPGFEMKAFMESMQALFPAT